MMKRILGAVLLMVMAAGAAQAVVIDYKGKRYQVNDYDTDPDSVSYCQFHRRVAKALGLRASDFYMSPSRETTQLYDTSTTMGRNGIRMGTVVFINEARGYGDCS